MLALPVMGFLKPAVLPPSHLLAVLTALDLHSLLTHKVPGTDAAQLHAPNL